MKKLVQCTAVAALVAGFGFSASSITQVSAQTSVSPLQQVSFVGSSEAKTPQAAEVRGALVSFIRGMSNQDAEAVWAFASEEDQDAFATQKAVLDAFDETFPELARAREVTVQSLRDEGDTPFVKLTMTDTNGKSFRGEIGLWQDDAGDWKVVSCEFEPLGDQVASL